VVSHRGGNGFNADFKAVLTRYQGRILQYTSLYCARSCATQTWIAYNRRTLIKSRVTSRTCSRTARLMHRQVATAHSTCKTRSICTRHIRLTEMRKVIAGRAAISHKPSDGNSNPALSAEAANVVAVPAGRRWQHLCSRVNRCLRKSSLPQQEQADARCQTPSSLSVWPSNGDPRSKAGCCVFTFNSILTTYKERISVCRVPEFHPNWSVDTCLCKYPLSIRNFRASSTVDCIGAIIS